MKHRNPLLQWAQARHYPGLSLPGGDYIAHGLDAWRRAARSPKRTLLAWQSIARWNAWEARAQAEQQERSA